MHTTDAQLSSFWPKETERLKSAEILTSAQSWYLEMMKLRERNEGQCCGKRKSCRSSRPISENFSYYPQLAMETDKDLDIWKAWLWTLKFAQIEVEDSYTIRARYRIVFFQRFSGTQPS